MLISSVAFQQRAKAGRVSVLAKNVQLRVQVLRVKKEFIGPGLHPRPVNADHALTPLQWTLNSVFSVYGNNNRRIRPPPDKGILKIISGLLLAYENTYTNHPFLQTGHKFFCTCQSVTSCLLIIG